VQNPYFLCKRTSTLFTGFAPKIPLSSLFWFRRDFCTKNRPGVRCSCATGAVGPTRYYTAPPFTGRGAGSHQQPRLVSFRERHARYFFVVWWGLRATVLGRLGGISTSVSAPFTCDRPPITGRGPQLPMTPRPARFTYAVTWAPG
jgi:hypothetical protein